MPAKILVFSQIGVGVWFVSYCCTLVDAESNGRCSTVLTVACIACLRWSLVTVSVCKVFEICLKTEGRIMVDFLLRICSKARKNLCFHLHWTQQVTAGTQRSCRISQTSDKNRGGTVFPRWNSKRNVATRFERKLQILCYWIVHISVFPDELWHDLWAPRNRVRGRAWAHIIHPQLTHHITGANTHWSATR